MQSSIQYIIKPKAGSKKILGTNQNRIGKPFIQLKRLKTIDLPKANVQEVAGVLAISAIPFLSVKAYANSQFGKDVFQNLKDSKAKLREQEKEFDSRSQQAKESNIYYGVNRPKWLGPIPYDSYPQYLNGSQPGDYAFDTLQLSQTPEDFNRNFEFEILHARWAMLGLLGALIPEILQYSGLASFTEPVWWRVGEAKLRGEDLNYLGVSGLRVAGQSGIIIIAIAQVILMYGPEFARSRGIEALEPIGIYLPGDKNYPGGVLFDPLGLSKDPEKFVDLQVKEMKNGRLAMVAWLGFFVQAAVTRKGPVDNAIDFWKDPYNETILKYIK